MSDKKISDKGISTAAELLYKGAKMLAYNCPECKVPLFEKDGKIFCPSCNREAIKDYGEKEIKKEVEKDTRDMRRLKNLAELEIDKKLKLAMCRICDMIVCSQSSAEVKELSESLEKLVDVMKKLKKM